jgi:hypothetical protein
MSPQFLVNIYHVSDAELEQKERSDYVSYYNTIIDEVCEDKHNIIYNNIEIEKAQLIDDKIIKDSNMLITLFKFIDLPILSRPDNLDSL